MHRNRVLALLAAALSASLLLAACGDDDGDGGSSEDEAQITEAIEGAATSGEASACTQFQTQRFNEQTTGETGAAAVKQCEDDAAETPADEAEVDNIEVDGDSASAEASLTGSFFDGQTLALDLVREGDQWKIDEATGFVDFDREHFVDQLKTSLQEESGGAPQEAIDCVTENIDALSDEEVENLFLNSDTQLEDQVFGSCFGGE